MPAEPLRRVVVVGGGLTGLAAAWWLRDHADVVLLEAGKKPGGAIRTVDVDGARLDMGADAILMREPAALRLLEALGLAGDALAVPATSRVLLWRGGRLRAMPEATALGVPTRLRTLASSGAVSLRGLLRAATEPVRRHHPFTDDVSVDALIAPRFGREIVDTLVDPLLGGVYASRADRLSARATVPAIWAAAEQGGSMLRVLARRRRDTPGSGGPVFATLREGLGQLVDRLAGELGARVVTGCRATGIRRSGIPGNSQWEVVAGDGRRWQADHVVVCVPAPVAARLLGEISAATADELARVAYASVAVVALAYARPTASLPQASGVLVPARQGTLVKAVTFSSRKWPHHADHRNWLLRASVGRIDDDRHDALDDDALVAAVDREVRTMIGGRAPAVARRVVRWPGALAQYEVGHLSRVDRLRGQLARDAAGVHLGGAALDGIGLAARCAQAELLAAAVRDAA